MHQETIAVATSEREELVDITDELRAIAARHPGARLMSIYARGATAAIMIQENWDPNIRTDILDCLSRLVPSGGWLHDRVDGNADAHIKSGIVGCSETVPLEAGEMLLSTWQNVFLCDFDGPRPRREVAVTLLP